MAKRRNREFESICSLAHVRAVAVVRCVEVLLPDADERKKKRICRKILSMCDGRDRTVRINEGQARDLILPHLQCLESQKERCPMSAFWEPISRSLNMFFNEED
jgi:hypothetical protein